MSNMASTFAILDVFEKIFLKFNLLMNNSLQIFQKLQNVMRLIVSRISLLLKNIIGKCKRLKEYPKIL